MSRKKTQNPDLVAAAATGDMSAAISAETERPAFKPTHYHRELRENVELLRPHPCSEELAVVRLSDGTERAINRRELRPFEDTPVAETEFKPTHITDKGVEVEVFAGDPDEEGGCVMVRFEDGREFQMECDDLRRIEHPTVGRDKPEWKPTHVYRGSIWTEEVEVLRPSARADVSMVRFRDGSTRTIGDDFLAPIEAEQPVAPAEAQELIEFTIPNYSMECHHALIQKILREVFGIKFDPRDRENQESVVIRCRLDQFARYAVATCDLPYVDRFYSKARIITPEPASPPVIRLDATQNKQGKKA